RLLSLASHMVTQRRYLVALLALPLALVFACDKVPLLAPTGTVITLLPVTTTVSLNSEVVIIATVIENGQAIGGTGTGSGGTTTTATAKITAAVGTLTGTSTVTVNARSLTSFSPSPSSASAGVPIVFNVTPATGANISNVHVDFGDGNSTDTGAIGGATPVPHT